MIFSPKLAAVAAKQALGIMVDPVPAYKFFIYLELGGVVEAKFTKISGMKMTRKIDIHREGGNEDQQRRLVGEIEYGDLTLERGITFSTNLWDWFHSYKPLNMSIILYSPYSLLPARWYDLIRAFPKELSTAEFNTDSNQIAIETLVLSFQEMKLNSSDTLGVGLSTTVSLLSKM